MNYVQFNIALNGRHFFRTDEYYACDLPKDFEQVLAAKFPKSEGYAISRSERPNTRTSCDVAN